MSYLATNKARIVISNTRMKWVANIIFCKCGCGKTRLNRDKKGNLHEYIKGHNNYARHYNVGKDHPNYKGGRIKNGGGYWMVLRHDHHEANRDGYVSEHRVVYEDYYHCYLLPWTKIHHKDGNKENNDISNLIPTTI